MDEPQETPITIYEELDAACHDYDPRAADVAARVARLIASHLPAVTVEHIGSTAIADCGVTDTIDYSNAKNEFIKGILSG